MQIKVTTRHGHLSDAAQDKIRAKAEKLLRFYDRLTAIEVVVDLKVADKPRVDIVAFAEHKHDLRGHDESDNLLTAVESAVQKVEQQIRKHKERTLTRHRDPDAKRQDELAPAEGDDSDAGAEEIGAEG